MRYFRLLFAPAIVAAICLLAVTPARADLLQSGSPVADLGTPLAPGGLFPVGPDGPFGGLDPGPPFFTGISNPILVPSGAGLLTIDVQDCCLVGDVYEVILNGASLGLTSIVPLGGPTLSTGSFSALVGAGVQSVSINDVLLSYIGFPDPFGGGVVPPVYSPAGLTEQVFGSPVPEPASLMLLGTGALALAKGLKKRLSQKS